MNSRAILLSLFRKLPSSKTEEKSREIILEEKDIVILVKESMPWIF